jgi:hypothetical protein
MTRDHLALSHLAAHRFDSGPHRFRHHLLVGRGIQVIKLA